VAGSGLFAYPFFTELYTGQVVQERLADEFASIRVVLAAPGRSDSRFLGVFGEPERLAPPLAGGLLFTAIGLHLWRWLEDPLT
jgi:hypothetical protein